VRTVFIGTSQFASAVLERLAASPHRPALVVTRPDAPRGRGRRLSAPPVAETARALDIELFQPENVNDEVARARIAAADPEVVAVCAFGALLREPLLSEHEMVNVHPSLLPRWRGAAPVERAIMAGDPETGVSIMRVTAGLDSGPVGLAAAEPIRPDDDYGTLTGRLRPLGGELLVRALDERRPWAEQDEARATYAEKIGPADRVLRGERSAEELERVVRALHPHIGARLESPALGVHRARALPGVAAGAPGELCAADGRLMLGARDGALELVVVQPPGGRAMEADAYLRGHPLA
jgi:methionyl-tRNA formyltransferase